MTYHFCVTFLHYCCQNFKQFHPGVFNFWTPTVIMKKNWSNSVAENRTHYIQISSSELAKRFFRNLLGDVNFGVVYHKFLSRCPLLSGFRAEHATNKWKTERVPTWQILEVNWVSQWIVLKNPVTNSDLAGTLFSRWKRPRFFSFSYKRSILSTFVTSSWTTFITKRAWFSSNSWRASSFSGSAFWKFFNISNYCQ